MIYGTCTQFCTDLTCPTMAAGKAEYLWKDGINYKKPTRVSAPVYIDLLLSWADERISNPALFPVEQGQSPARRRRRRSQPRTHTRCTAPLVCNGSSARCALVLTRAACACFACPADAKFPRQFLSEVKQIYKRLFRSAPLHGRAPRRDHQRTKKPWSRRLLTHSSSFLSSLCLHMPASLYAHLYCSHSEKIRSIGANAHVSGAHCGGSGECT